MGYDIVDIILFSHYQLSDIIIYSVLAAPQSECPISHPYPDSDGGVCCKDEIDVVENGDQKLGGRCVGEGCCKNNDHVKCTTPPCKQREYLNLVSNGEKI